MSTSTRRATPLSFLSPSICGREPSLLAHLRVRKRSALRPLQGDEDLLLPEAGGGLARQHFTLFPLLLPSASFIPSPVSNRTFSGELSSIEGTISLRQLGCRPFTPFFSFLFLLVLTSFVHERIQ